VQDISEDVKDLNPKGYARKSIIQKSLPNLVPRNKSRKESKIPSSTMKYKLA
jgi:hypothetical protein